LVWVHKFHIGTAIPKPFVHAFAAGVRERAAAGLIEHSAHVRCCSSMLCTVQRLCGIGAVRKPAARVLPVVVLLPPCPL
jgi:hypothetical protein